jgi:DNA modification methylase
MQIESVALNKIIPYIRNPRKNENAIEKVASSIKEFGFRQPIVVDSENVIIAGHTRFEAAKRLGLDVVPIHVADGLTEQQAKAYRIADNRVGQESEWDYDLLKLEMEELDNPELTGFDEDELNGILAEVGEGMTGEEGLTDPDQVPEAPAIPVTVSGDLWELGEHRLLCGDATKAENVDRLLGGEKADMVFTDPPYGMGLDTDYSKIKGSLKSIGFKGNTLGNKYAPVIGDDTLFDPSFLIEYFKTAKEQFWWGADYYIDKLPDCGMSGTLQVWNKRSSDAQQEGLGNCFELCWSMKKHKKYVFNFEWFGFLSRDDPKEARNRIHPTMKPTKLINRFFERWGDGIKLVIDLFLGSGSTLIACQKTGRKCYGMEIDPQYCDVIISRWSEFTGKDDLLLNGKPFKWSERKIKKAA